MTQCKIQRRIYNVTSMTVAYSCRFQWVSLDLGFSLVPIFVKMSSSHASFQTFRIQICRTQTAEMFM